MINIFQPTLGSEELAAVANVFESSWLGRGPRTKEFEAAFADHLGVDSSHVRSISCCTEGLFLALELLGIGEGDEVVVPTISFVGAANAVMAAGATPVFCDVDRRTLNPRPEQVEAMLSPRTRAILPLHYGGLPGQIADLAQLATDRGLKLIEDAACGVASRVGEAACGTLGDVGVWSFDAMKIVVTGDGGMIYVRDPEQANRLDQLTYLGLEAESGASQAAHASRWWEFEVSSPSRRSIMNDLGSSLGLVQLRRLPEFLARRQEVWLHYERELNGIEWLELPLPVNPGSTSSHYLYWVQLPDEATRDQFAAHLLAREIYTTFRYHPLHKVSLYGSDASLVEAEDAARRTLCLPIHQGLDDSDLDRIIEGVHEFAGSAKRAA